MAGNDTRDLIQTAIERVFAELPALRKLPIVFQLELRGRGDTQQFRIALTGDDKPATIEKGTGEGAKVIVGITRPHFNQLAEKGTLALWREAFRAGHAHAAGPPQLLKLIVEVADRHDRRAEARRR